MIRLLVDLWNDERGVAISEYALVLAVAGIIMIVAFTAVNTAAGNQYDATTTKLTTLQENQP